jgi:hypothetical protein
VLTDHAVGAEAVDRGRPAGAAVEAGGGRQRGGQSPQTGAQEAGDAVLHDLGRGAERWDDHRRPGRQRLDHHQAEGLGPLQRVEQGDRRAEQLQLLRPAELADVLHVRAEQRADLGVEVRALGRLAQLGGHPQRHARGPRGEDRLPRPLLRAHPAEEAGVPAVPTADGDVVDVDAVVDDGGERHTDGGGGLVPGDGHDRHPVHRPVDRAERGVEGAVGGHHHGEVRVAVAVQRADQRVVVDDVDAASRIASYAVMTCRSSTEASPHTGAPPSAVSVPATWGTGQVLLAAAASSTPWPACTRPRASRSTTDSVPP